MAKKAAEMVGVLQGIAAMMLMTVFYASRVARSDLRKALNFAAKRITRWETKCYARLHRLMCCICYSRNHKMKGCVGDDPRELTVQLFCDADFVGCPYTRMSASGVHMDVQGSNTRFPWSSSSNQQTSTAQRTRQLRIGKTKANRL